MPSKNMISTDFDAWDVPQPTEQFIPSHPMHYNAPDIAASSLPADVASTAESYPQEVDGSVDVAFWN